MAVSLAALLCVPAPVTSQQTTTIEERKCEGCSINIRQIAKLESNLDGPFEGQPSSMSRASNGKYFVTQYVDHGEVAVFRPDGSFERKIGRIGDGPGEFRKIAHVTVLADSLIIFDDAKRTISILSPDFDYVRSLRFPAVATHDVITEGRTLVTISDIPTPDLAGLPVHEFNLDSQTKRSYGAVEAIYRPQSPWITSRVMSGSSSTGLWLAKRTAYELELWQNGKHQRTLRRNAPWFRPYVDRTLGSSAPPDPWLMAIRLLDDRYLAVMITHPVENYTELLGPKIRRGGYEYYDFQRRRLLYDTRIEIVDTRAACVVYSADVDEYVLGFVDGTSIFYTYDEVDGVPVVKLFELSFRQR